ncbi:hypothetical protein P9239_19210 [Caballeronia sp. LZ062]|uniref:hypothetical protein n=1 Tax=unclassified Caballeronia TaxID=2646786 RepID=UPI0028546120|nr:MULTISPECIES: hypothetical protein [unclassified Caballeronia]MDR5855732.1 hypothetical protein [Caballeronia sp. LZ050]MDR5872481.1 hypothetical protein [Caballeronia sp. LZ062]
MKVWVKVIAWFLIAWLPLLGYAAQVTLCPEMSSMANGHQQTDTVHPTGKAGCTQDSDHRRTDVQPPCHGNTSGTICGMAAIPVTHTVIAVSSSRVYSVIAEIPWKQFIPELPAPPPRFV